MIDPDNIPLNPGCYLFYDSRNQVIYIGKAKKLKNRVRSYFTGNQHSLKTRAMLKAAEKVDFIVTENEVEALILENNLIKKYQPRFNIDLKDAKTFAFLRITGEEFPRLVIARKKEGPGEYFGPFVSASARDEIRTSINNIFGLRTCRKIPKRPCLRYYMNTCQAPCRKKISAAAYSEHVDQARSVLKGNIAGLIDRLHEKMQRASGELNFEQALLLRKRIEAVRRIVEKQKMQRQKKFDEDIIHAISDQGKTFVMLFNIHRGILENKQEFVFDERLDFPDEFILRYYATHPIPREIIMHQLPGPAIKKYLEIKRPGPVNMHVPQQGDKKILLDLVKTNLEKTFLGKQKILGELKELLDLEKIPFTIECFDISHLSGTAMVASMVRFSGGRPDKSGYRRFRIRSVSGINDPAAMSEVVRRRYSRLQRENREMPDLVVVDGGAAQLHSAEKTLKQLELSIPLAGIAKKFEEIYLPHRNRPLRLDLRSPALKLIQQIRDEAHRFAIAYHHAIRSKEIRE